jgi:hypothetical protein
VRVEVPVIVTSLVLVEAFDAPPTAINRLAEIRAPAMSIAATMGR